MFSIESTQLARIQVCAQCISEKGLASLPDPAKELAKEASTPSAPVDAPSSKTKTHTSSLSFSSSKSGFKEATTNLKKRKAMGDPGDETGKDGSKGKKGTKKKPKKASKTLLSFGDDA